ncbi:hypothetical protein MtrunA17_Chr8g0362211 [Medicago truncatula]|uniref:PB1-like domain-containing protein n=1 Tax=Medicago truncatula TaxID=3880 RepID=A0A396GJB7_MEDTR|nr:hypothetical protein MtrunA17_Chr8g0362211 [Medicago truncatula]
MDQLFECVLHHAWDLSCFSDPEYVGPEEVLDCNSDFFSYFALLSTLKGLGYISLKSLWYFDPSLEDGMVALNNDLGCRRMQSIAYEFDKVHLYVVHPMSQPEIVELNPLIEYPMMTPHVPPVRNETNEIPTSVGPTAECEGANVDGGVSGVGPSDGCEGANVDGGVNGVGPSAECTNADGPELDLNEHGPMIDENELFAEYDNGPELGQNSNGPELGKEGVNVSEPAVEETVNVGEPGLGNEDENVSGEKEDSALNVHFGDSEDEGVIQGDLDSEDLSG